MPGRQTNGNQSTLFAESPIQVLEKKERGKKKTQEHGKDHHLTYLGRNSRDNRGSHPKDAHFKTERGKAPLPEGDGGRIANHHHYSKAK